MNIKRVITSGCSFSDFETPWTWPHQLERYIKNIDPEVTFDHRGLSSQGQDLIQKKASHAVMQAINEGFSTDGIAVVVMWSGIDRKAFYIDNPLIINDIAEGWKGSQQGWQLQFADLTNKIHNYSEVNSAAKYGNNIPYDKDGGWFITSAHVNDGSEFIKGYFLMAKHMASSGPVHYSLENVLMLQNLCKAKGIKLYHQFYMDHVLGCFEQRKDHQIVEYLYDDIDWDTVVSKTSIHAFLKGLNEDEKMFVDRKDPHPSEQGHITWCNEVLVPYLKTNNFFD